MGVVAELGRLAIAAWSPGGGGGGYIAAGTFAGAIDPSFTSAASLELLSVDIQRAELSVVSDVRTADKFCSVDWGSPTKAHPAGLIAGGLSDGTVRVWDAATLLRSPKSIEDENKAVVFGGPAVAKHHAGAVRGLAFNPFLPTKLASGATDGQVLIWDLSNPAAGAVVRPPVTSSKPPAPSMAPKEEVTALAWNKKFQPILASGTVAGVTNVWDLKQGKQVINIRNPRGRLRVSSLTWHPDVATQIVVGCDEDDSTGAVLWDLRNASAPVMTFAHHSPKGVSASSWCPHDTDLLLTSARDSRTVIVSVASGDIVSEAPQSADWNFDVKWSPRVPGMYLASSFDGRLSVNSMMTSTTAPAVTSETANALAESFGEMAGGFQAAVTPQSPRTVEAQRVRYSVDKPPKWLKKPVSVSFGFGGWRASVVSKDSGKVNLATFSQNYPGLKECSAKLDSVLMDVTSDDPTPARKLCEEAGAAAETPEEKMGWDALALMFQTDSRRKLLSYLGFELPPKDAGDDIAMPVYGLAQSQPLAVPVRPIPALAPEIVENAVGNQSGVGAVTNGAAGLNLDGPAPWEIPDPADNSADVGDSILDGDDAANGGDEYLGNGQNGMEGAGDGAKTSFVGMGKEKLEALIKKSIIVGDFQSAVDACLHIGRTADALIIAHAGGPDLWLHTQAAYLAKERLSAGVSVVGAVAGPKSKMDDYIRECADAGKEAWKDALAVVLTYCPGEELSEACTALGQRLLVKENHGAALFCFICAGSTRMAATTWMRERPSTSKISAVMLADRVERLIVLVQKVRLVTSATLLGRGEREIGAVKALDEVSGSVLCEFGALLAAQGDLETAITYLGNLDPTFTSVYGAAGDIHAQAADCLAVTESANVSSYDAGTSGQAYGGYDNSFNQPTYDYGNANASWMGGGSYGSAPAQSAGRSWERPAAATVPAPPSYSAPASNDQQYTAPPPVPQAAAPSPAMAAPPRPAGVFSSQGGTADRGTYDAPAAYSAAPSYDDNPYAAPPPPVPVAPAMAAGAPPTNTTPYAAHGQYSVASTVPPPAPVPMAMGSATVPAPMNGGAYGMSGAPMGMGVGGGMGGGMGVQTLGAEMGAVAPPPPPPPPPADGGAPMPMSYHSNARRGSGASLPPSAEVAVAETRRSKPLSSSGTPGGAPRRNASTSSSLSALGAESVFLDKADTSRVPAGQQVIVKSLRGAFSYACTLNKSGMYRKKMDDVSKKLGRLVAGLNAGVVDGAVVELLVECGTCIEKRNYDQASVVVGTLTKQHWDSNSQWIQALKRLIDCVLTGR